jgi:ElaB/YqjD/DUF883 family membrane-anchored ribosome-binding protein
MDNTDQNASSGSAQGLTGASAATGRDQLVSDIKLVSKDAEDMLKGAGQQFDKTAESARARFQSTLQNVKGQYDVWGDKVLTGSKDTYANAERYVKDNPWQAVGIGAAAGVLLGMLIGRSK